MVKSGFTLRHRKRLNSANSGAPPASCPRPLLQPPPLPPQKQMNHYLSRPPSRNQRPCRLLRRSRQRREDASLRRRMYLDVPDSLYKRLLPPPPPLVVPPPLLLHLHQTAVVSHKSPGPGCRHVRHRSVNEFHQKFMKAILPHGV